MIYKPSMSQDDVSSIELPKGFPFLFMEGFRPTFDLFSWDVFSRRG